MEHGRLHWYEPAELNAEQRVVYDAITQGARSQQARAFSMTDERGRLHGPFNAMMVSPDTANALQAFTESLRFRSDLTPRAREIAILEVAAHARSPFEWYAHAAIGRLIGFSDAEIDALRYGTPAPSFDAKEQLIRELTQALLEARDLDDAAFARARNELGERALADLIMLVGVYELIARWLRVWRVPLPAGETSAFPEAPA